MKEMNKTKSALLAAAALTVATAASTASEAPKWAKKGDVIEKCAGVAMKGKNDCGANGHSCAGMSKKNNDAKEWVYTPAGLCAKIGGKVIKKTTI